MSVHQAIIDDEDIPTAPVGDNRNLLDIYIHLYIYCNADLESQNITNLLDSDNLM